MPHHRGLPSGQVPGPARAAEAQASSALDLDFTALSDPGKVRTNNEDYLGHAVPESPEQARQRGWLFGLADGVGGQEFGEIASRTAIETLLAGHAAAPVGEQPAALLARLVQAANLRVYETGRAAAPGGVAMATTLVACTLRYDRATIAHVGDSRCYLIRHGQAMALTRDHTVVNEQIRLGVISAREAAKSEARHILSRSLGNDLFVNVDIGEHQVSAGDILLLCSDGLHGAVAPHEISRVISQAADLNAAALHLVELANENDGSDNVSVLLIRIRNVERVGMYRGRPYKLR